MQPQRSLWKLLIISFFAFLVVACKPIASFSVTPDPVKVGIEATFDASASMADVLPKNNAIKSYAWSFGDGATAAGKTAKHTYATAGTFKVKLTVIDTAGDKGEATESLVVTAGEVVVQTTTLKVITQIAGGVSLTGAEVTVGNASGTSDANGLATLGAAPVGENQVVTVKKAGYITQVVRKTLAADTADQQMLVLLMPEKDTLSVAAIESAQTIKSNYLGASVTLPANAFVNAATGAPADGAATLKLTPWDISGIDLQAMPGNGRAKDLAGNLVDLISAGMMSVEFTDAAGNKLQVASGTTADIQMDLPAGTTSVGDNALSVGSLIPMWHFDEAQGLWLEEGTGSVVATASGLAVKATVNHFSTWNWDFKFENAGSVNVSCVDSTNQLVACNVLAKVMLDDGSLFTRTSSLPAAVTTVINMPSSGSITWKAATSDGLLGETTSGTSGTVVISIGAPTTSNFVQCILPGGAATACDAVLTTNLTNGNVATTSRYIPAAGANVKTSFVTMGSLNWAVKSKPIVDADGQWKVFSGVQTSGISGNVTLALTDSSVVTGKTVYVQCDPNTMRFNQCTVSILVVDEFDNVIGSFFETIDGANGPKRVEIPAYANGYRISFAAFGNTPDRTVYGDYVGNITKNFDAIVDGETIDIQLAWLPPVVLT